MKPGAEFVVSKVKETPRTAEATFTITAKDVGSKAVRPGHMAELEEERKVLLLACVTLLNRIRGSNVAIGAPYEFLLESAIKAVQHP